MKEKKGFSNNKQSIIGIVTMFFVVVLIMLSVANYYITVKTNEINNADKKLIDLAKSNIFSAETYFEGQKASLRAIAFALEGYEDLTSEEVIDFLNNTAERLGYERLAIDFLDGSSYTSDGAVFDVTDMGFLDNVRNGEHFVGNVKVALADGREVVSVFAPIFRDGKPIAAVRSAIGTDTITKKIAIDFAGEKYYFHLIDGEGNYVANNSSSNALLMDRNFFEAMQELTYEEDYSYDKFMADVKEGKAGYTKYAFEDAERYAYYAPAGINDWIMMTIVPKDVVEGLIGDSLNTTIVLSLEIMFALLVLFGYILWGQRKARLKSVLDESCFRVLSEQTGNIIFEWDFKKRQLISMSSNFEKVFGRYPYTSHSEMEAIQAKAIHPDDIDTFTDVFRDISSGQNVKDVKFRIRDVKGEFVWCSVSGVAVNHSNGKPFKAIGSIRSIDDEEKETQTLRDKAQKDLLTGLYNKLSTEALVFNYMKEHGKDAIKGALLMIDIDNFKGVNDTLGHQFGDKVLKDAAAILKKIFRTSDILGRVGGDEFIVFMKDVLDMSIVQERAKDICTNMAQTFFGEQMYKVSTSVGIAMYPEHGSDFGVLYNHADIALYQAKRNGKNSYMFYDSTITVEGVSVMKPIDSTENFIASHFAGDPIHNIFEMLYETKNMDITINIILGILGKQFLLDRCYVLTVSQDGTVISNTHEWCEAAIMKQQQNLQNIPMEEMQPLLTKYNADGLFYCNDCSLLTDFPFARLFQTDVKSLFQCAITESKKLYGVIGFHECKIVREWSESDIANLTYIARILSVFILKKYHKH